MIASDLKEKYLSFFVRKGHRKLANVSLVPENDPTTLFISAGMQPLIPYLMGEPHPLGKKLVSLQRCLRTGDIEEVGNVFHNTFFEMLGNWSLGDYWKKESLSLSYQFLTKELNLDPRRLHVTLFKGDRNVPKDEESEKIWLSLGIPRKRIYFLGKKDNWWEAGKAGPGGPDSEIFYDLDKAACGADCRPGDGCGRFFEMWNNVFMEYNRLPDGTYEKLEQKNVDTGMGVERSAVVLEGKKDIFQTTTLKPIVVRLESASGFKYQDDYQKPMRIIADHLRAAVFVIADGVAPSNYEQGYVLRRLVRRAIRYGRPLKIKKPFLKQIAEEVVALYQKSYPHLKEKEGEIIQTLESEEKQFSKTLAKGLRELEKLTGKKTVSGKEAFYLYETYGFPFEMTAEIVESQGLKIDRNQFKKAQQEHRKKSRASLEKKFKGGLADHSEAVTKLHTATHLLHQALRDVLGDHVRQVGSNITPERLRFDFTHPEKLTAAQIEKIGKIINQKIKEDLPVKMKVMGIKEAGEKNARALFVDKYQDKVKTYRLGDYSFEVCGGPHVSSTGEIRGVKIDKEKPVGAGRRRIYARLVSR